MEILGSYDLEMSLFNGDMQLVGLTSPVEVEPQPLLGHVGLDFKGDPAPGIDGLHKSGSVEDTTMVSLLDQGSGLLEYPWLDTKVDLADLLRESDRLAMSLAEPMDSLPVPSITTQANDQTVAPLTAEDLFSTIESGGGSVTHLASFEAGNAANIDGQMLVDFLSKLTEDLDPSMDSQIASLTTSEAVLSPVSAEDIESVLSYPGSPMESLSEAETSMDDPDYMPESSEPAAGGSGSRKRKAVSGEDELSGVKDKKQRKKIQNKTAALRYRKKKKSEQTILDEQVEDLEEKNKDLQDKVDSMSQEINYLKKLMAEVVQAKHKAHKA